jgi:hypothetical protein
MSTVDTVVDRSHAPTRKRHYDTGLWSFLAHFPSTLLEAGHSVLKAMPLLASALFSPQALLYRTALLKPSSVSAVLSVPPFC